MSRSKQDSIPSFEWPEPLVIEITLERYQDIADGPTRTALARLHAATLRELCADRARQAASLRLELIAACAAQGIAAERIAGIDLAVFVELARIAAARFRTSPRLQALIHARLDAALSELRPRNAAPARARVSTSAGSRLLRPAAAIG